MFRSEEKQCTKCDRWLPLDRFSRKSSSRDGRRSRCKDCELENQRVYRARRRAERGWKPPPPKYKGDLRHCTKCKRYLPTTEFYRNRSMPDGLACWCKECTYADKLQRQRENRDEYNAYQRQYSEDHPEKRREYSRRVYAKHGDKIKARVAQYYREGYSERAKENARRWNERNPEKVKAARRKHYESHREEKATYARQWGRDNREKRQAYGNNYRARKKANGGSFTATEWQSLCNYYDNRCLCCGTPASERPLTVDHVIPISRGGSNSISNIQCLCQQCNSSKHTKSTDYRPQPTLEVAICPTRVMAQAI